MSKLNGNALQIGNNATATQNCTLTANGDGTFTLARGNVGATTQDLLTIDSSGVVELTQKNQIKSGTVIDTSTGQTFYDIPSIPSWVKKITLMFSAVSTSGTSNLLIQLADSGGIETVGYVGVASERNAGGGFSMTAMPSSGFSIKSTLAANILTGKLSLTLLDSNEWIIDGTIVQTNGTLVRLDGTGSKTLSAALDRIRLTTVNGTDLFDAGKINILYEG